MKKKLMIAIVTALVFTLALSTVALAQDDTPTAPAEMPADPIYMEVAHMVQGNQIGLSQETPLVLNIIRNGVAVGYASMNFRDRVGLDTFAGDFEFSWTSLDTGEVLLHCGPYSFGDTSQVRVQAHEKGAGRIPDCYTKELE